MFSALISCRQKENSKAEWKKQETLSAKEKKAYIIALKEEFPYFELAENPGLYLDKFTFLDLDHDGDQDLIYIGESGAEPFCIRVFLNKSEKFVKVFDEFSNTPELKFQDKDLTGITVFQTMCCGENYQDHVKTWKIQIKKDVLEKQKTEDYYLFTVHEDPKMYASPYTIRITAKANMRFSPKLNVKTDTIYKEQIDMEENIICSLQKDALVEVLSELEDKGDGRTWLYIEADHSALASIGNWIAADGAEYKVRGWISKKNTEKASRSAY